MVLIVCESGKIIKERFQKRYAAYALITNKPQRRQYLKTLYGLIIDQAPAKSQAEIFKKVIEQISF